jgi:mRNA-degrading endonuclease toxin of MazEF toxin-antitoxin module
VAQYWEDWSGSTIGNGPTGWTKRWAGQTDFLPEVESHQFGPAGRRLALKATGSGRRALTFNAVDTDATRGTAVKIRALVEAPAMGGAYNVFYALLARGAGAAGNESGYMASMQQTAAGGSTQAVSLRRFLDGAASDLRVSGNGIFTSGARYWLGLECVGTNRRITLAEAATPQTLIYDQTLSDPSSIPAAGWVGLFLFATIAQPYYVYAVGVGTNGDEAPLSDPAGDVTAPVVSSPTGAATGNTTAIGSVTTNEAGGTLYAVATANGTTPTAAQVIAGNNATGAAGAYAASQAVAATGVQNVAATGLIANTAYFWHFVHRDAAGNNSAVVTSASFTTSAGTVKGVRIALFDRAGAARANTTGIVATWWDNASGTGAYAFQTQTAAISAAQLELNFNASTALAVGAQGHLKLYKAGATPETDWHFSSRLPVQNIA